ncbi:MAG: hypothetical protein K2N73_03830 [Lachnospiraceae bacterium]|nr:hypothetical protein [Lachnospiraceae bacterium]
MNKFNTEERVEDITAYNGSDGNDAYIEYRKFHYKNTVPDSRVLVFLTGFCIGMVFFYLFNGKNAGVSGLLDREHLLQLQSFEVNQSGLFEYVVGLRLKQLAFCIICSLSSIGSLLAYSIMGWYGFEAGLIIFSLVYQYGIKGIFLTFSMFLPHGAFYVIGFLIIFSKYWVSDTKCCHKEETIKDCGRHKKMENLKKIILVLAVFGIGILSEIYVNPEIVRKMALFF